MKASSVNDIKKELTQLSNKELVSICMRVAKFKKENKELVSYILFEEKFPETYLESFKAEIDHHFTEINYSNIYYIKKSLRKIVRHLNKNIRYVNSDFLKTEMLIHFCNNIIEYSLPIHKSQQLMNIFKQNMRKLHLIMESLHPDLQYDLKKKLRKLEMA